jgi:CHASE3 domain sensor protein
LQVLEAQPEVHLGRLVRMASTVTEVRQAMEATAAQALTEQRESLERLQANLEPQAEPAAMAARAELQVLEGQPVVRLARLGPTALWATEAMPAAAEPVALVQRELQERVYLAMAEPAAWAEQEGAEVLVEPQVVWEGWPEQMV